MYDFIPDRRQEIALLKFAKDEAKYLKHNIDEAKKLEPILKKDGSIHKTKVRERATIIKGWEKEIEKLRKFFNKHKSGGLKNDFRRYKYREKISDGREHLIERYDDKE